MNQTLSTLSPSSSSTSSSSSHQITELARNKMLLHYINHHSLQPQPKIHQCFFNSNNPLPLFSPSRPIWMIWCPGSQLLNVPWWVWHHCIASTINASPQSSALPLQLYLILIVYALAILCLCLWLFIISINSTIVINTTLSPLWFTRSIMLDTFHSRCTILWITWSNGTWFSSPVSSAICPSVRFPITLSYVHRSGQVRWV